MYERISKSRDFVVKVEGIGIFGGLRVTIMFELRGFAVLYVNFNICFDFEV